MLLQLTVTVFLGCFHFADPHAQRHKPVGPNYFGEQFAMEYSDNYDFSGPTNILTTPLARVSLFPKDQNCESEYPSPHMCDSFGRGQFWDCPETPPEQRNNIGRAIFQTRDLVKRSQRLINLGTIYQLAHPIDSLVEVYEGRNFNISDPQCSPGGGCTTPVSTDAIGNVGTQFDGFGHFFGRDPITGEPTFFNNFKLDQVYPTWADTAFNESRSGQNGYFKYIGIDQLPYFFTRCILVDVVSYINRNIHGKNVESDYKLEEKDFIEILKWQGLHLGKNFEFELGDVVLFRFGWAQFFADNDYDNFYALPSPGISLDIVLKYFWDTGVMILGSDTFAVEAVGVDEAYPVHLAWLPCAGGFLHEALNLEQWASDAKRGFAPYVGVYSFGVTPYKGACGSSGAPVVLV